MLDSNIVKSVGSGNIAKKNDVDELYDAMYMEGVANACGVVNYDNPVSSVYNLCMLISVVFGALK